MRRAPGLPREVRAVSYPVRDSARISADIERPDKIVAGLTARQLAILASTGVVLWLGFLAVRHLVSAVAYAAAAAPVAALAAGVALGSRDGLSLDRLAVAALRQARAPRRLVNAPEGVAPPPDWAPAASGALPAALRLPALRVTQDGCIDLGSDGVAVLLECTTVSFALSTAGEQEAMTGVFARLLNSLTGPVQILIRAERIDLAPAIARLRDAAAGLPHQALEDAALQHAAFLAELDATRDLLRRQVLLVIREPSSRGQLDAAAARALRRAAGAARTLAAAGVQATVLDGYQAATVIAAACDPWQQVPSGAPDAVITRSPA
jgi:PrgI family protein